ncbi:MAG: hypothetical protein ACFCUI_12305 [Bernardetiaceae bacterium]
MSFILAESGGSKTDWYDHRTQKHYRTAGLHPFLTTPAQRQDSLKSLPFDPLPRAVFFYGAGCGQALGQRVIQDELRQYFGATFIQVQSDLMAAAHATAGDSSGIVAILGTGSHAGRFDGQHFTQQAYNLGYLLGDEASGADFGKQLLRAYAYGELPLHLHRAWEARFGAISRDQILTALYRQDNPNRFLAGFAPFLFDHSEEQFCQDMLQSRLRLFAERHLHPLQAREKILPVHVVGGLMQASSLARALTDLLNTYGWSVGVFCPYPLERLIAYHTKKPPP